VIKIYSFIGPVIILYNADKVADSVQHLIKWIMDRYTDACKLILCYEDDADIIDSMKTRCRLIPVDAPVTHEVIISSVVLICQR